MHVISIGSDKKLFDRDSAVAHRARAYGARFGTLDIIVFTLKNQGFSKMEIAPGVCIFPTQSAHKLLYIRDAVRVGLRLRRADVITVQDPFESGLAGIKLSKKLHVPLHVQLHTDIFDPGFRGTSLLNRLRIHIAPYVLRHASRVRTVSQTVAEKITKKYRIQVPITALPVFVDVQRFASASVPSVLAERFSDFAYKVLVVSRLEKEKNPCLAMRAFAASAPKTACLIVVGEGSEKSLLQKLSRELKIESRVFFEGFQDPAPYYKFADLVLVTSRYEGYGLVIVEALAAGTPVLSTDVGIAREAGAIISNVQGFSKALATWFVHGPKEAQLQLKSYPSMDAYVLAYCEDILQSTQR